jgi:glycosyltransferase involved in cell wall biosynthesis
MKGKGHEVRILVGGTGIFNLRASKINLEVISLLNLVREISPIKDIKGFYEIKRAIEDFSPDIVHLHSSKAGILGRLACHSLKLPCVFTAHGWAFTEGVSSGKRRLYLWIESFMAKFATKIITVSEYDRQLALNHNVGNSELIKTIHNGVPDYSVSLSGNVSNKLASLIMVARFDSPKNQTFLIEALHELRTLPFEMKFVGDGPELDECKKLVLSLGLTNNVYFLGARNDVPNLLAESNVFLLLSNWEGLPLTILEAMSHSLPIVASDVGGVPETIQENEHGFLIPRDDKERLVEVLKNLIESPELCSQIGRNARLRYEQDFTVNLMIDSTELIYFQAIDK